jgi:hypothetical protein
VEQNFTLGQNATEEPLNQTRAESVPEKTYKLEEKNRPEMKARPEVKAGGKIRPRPEAESRAQCYKTFYGRNLRIFVIS